MAVDQDRLDRIKAAEALPESSSQESAPSGGVANDWQYGGSLAAFLGDDEPDDDDSSDWHLRGLVARDVSQIFGGDAKVGKTMMCQSIAVALAQGAPTWCGLPIYGGRKRVLFMPREDSKRTTRVRNWQLARGAGMARPHELGEYLEIDPTSPLNMAKPEHIAKLREACKRFDVIFIDSFMTTHLGDENSAKDVAIALEPARDLAISTNTSIVFIHHYNGKGNTDDKRGVKHRLRGSSAIAGYVRHIVGVSHGPKRGQVEISSDGNLEYQLEPTIVERVSGTTDQGNKTLSYRHIGSAEGAALSVARDEVVKAVEAAEDGLSSANAIAKEVGGNRKIVLAAVKAELKLEPLGRLYIQGKRIYSRSPVLEPARNQSVPSTGTGSAPYRAHREPQAEWWDK
jgi:hypothetical protein